MGKFFWRLEYLNFLHGVFTYNLLPKQKLIERPQASDFSVDGISSYAMIN